MDVGTEVSTEYVSDCSDYVSSVEGNTPFPSLTLSKKIELERYLHNGVIVSRFSQVELQKPNSVKDLVTNDSVKQESVKDLVKEESVNNGCCLLL